VKPVLFISKVGLVLSVSAIGTRNMCLKNKRANGFKEGYFEKPCWSRLPTSWDIQSKIGASKTATILTKNETP
jgi:hypothetical protein